MSPLPGPHYSFAVVVRKPVVVRAIARDVTFGASSPSMDQIAEATRHPIRIRSLQRRSVMPTRHGIFGIASMLSLSLFLTNPGLAVTAQDVAPQGSASGLSAAVKIGVIDTEKILLNSDYGKAALADIKKLQSQRESEIQAALQEIKDLQARLDAARSSSTPEQVKQLEGQVQEKRGAEQRFQDEATRELTKRRDDMLNELDSKIMPVINQVAREGHFTLIFRKFESGLIYADDAVDITGDIIQRLNDASPTRK